MPLNKHMYFIEILLYSRLYRDNYEATLVSMLERAKFLQLPEETPCQRDFFKKITVRENDVLVLFFRLDEDIKRFRNNAVWETLAHVGLLSFE